MELDNLRIGRIITVVTRTSRAPVTGAIAGMDGEYLVIDATGDDDAGFRYLIPTSNIALISVSRRQLS